MTSYLKHEAYGNILIRCNSHYYACNGHYRGQTIPINRLILPLFSSSLTSHSIPHPSLIIPHPPHLSSSTIQTIVPFFLSSISLINLFLAAIQIQIPSSTQFVTRVLLLFIVNECFVEIIFCFTFIYHE